MSPLGRWLAVLLAVAGAAVVGVALWQSSVLLDHAEACARVRHEQERQLERARAARNNWERLQAETAELDGEIARLAAVVPERTGVEGIVDRVRAWCVGHGLELCRVADEVVDRELYDEIQLTLGLCGQDDLDPARLPDTWSLPDWVGPRAAALRGVSPHPGGLEVRLAVYATEGFQGPTREDWCDEARWPEPSTRLWPFASRARRAGERLRELCPELAENRAYTAAVEELEARRRYLAFSRQLAGALLEREGARTTVPLADVD